MSAVGLASCPFLQPRLGQEKSTQWRPAQWLNMRRLVMVEGRLFGHACQADGSGLISLFRLSKVKTLLLQTTGLVQMSQGGLASHEQARNTLATRAPFRCSPYSSCLGRLLPPHPTQLHRANYPVCHIISARQIVVCANYGLKLICDCGLPHEGQKMKGEKIRAARAIGWGGGKACALLRHPVLVCVAPDLSLPRHLN